MTTEEKPKVKVLITRMNGEVLDEQIVSPFQQEVNTDYQLANAVADHIGNKFEMEENNG